jgi:hypothetical protein
LPAQWSEAQRTLAQLAPLRRPLSHLNMETRPLGRSQDACLILYARNQSTIVALDVETANQPAI